MARIIDLGQIELTKISGYRWEISPAVDEDGKRFAQITEVYVVTDDEYSRVPEGQKRNPLTLTLTQQRILNKLFKDKIIEAATREQVNAEAEAIPEDTA